MIRAVAYVRVSTKEQDEKVQINAIEKFAKENSIEVLKYFIDKGESRMKKWENRPAAKQLIEFLEKGGKDIVGQVIVFDFTRLGANMMDMLNFFIKLEKELGVKVISVKDEWLKTKDKALRQLLIAIFSWLAEMEWRLRRERQQAAWESGKQKGRPPKLKDGDLIYYLRKYPNLSLRAITDLINAERERKKLPKVSYYTVLAKAKKLGFQKRIVKTGS